MQKLIELLNEYGNEKYNHWGDYQTDMDFTDRDTYWYLSKKFGLIKWLVENDKIDLEKLEEKAERKPHYIFTTDDGRLGFKLFEVYETLLMLLSISNSPIEDLLLYLK